MIYLFSISLLVGYVTLVSAQAVKPPTVKLDQGKFIGVANLSIDKFLSIPFAKPPFVTFISLLDCPTSDEMVLHYQGREFTPSSACPQ